MGTDHELRPRPAIGPISDVRVSTHPDVEITLIHFFLDMANVVRGRLGLLRAHDLECEGVGGVM